MTDLQNDRQNDRQNEPQITRAEIVNSAKTESQAPAAIQLDQDLGGKAAVLKFLAGKGFPVPEIMSLRAKPTTEAEWSEVLSWWSSIRQPALAVRSSAKGEDGGEQSFAGQFQSFLNINDEQTLREAVEKCFASIERVNIAAYAQATGIDVWPY